MSDSLPALHSKKSHDRSVSGRAQCYVVLIFSMRQAFRWVVKICFRQGLDGVGTPLHGRFASSGMASRGAGMLAGRMSRPENNNKYLFASSKKLKLA
ncbi:hypothetical protein [Burkholderia sp. F1]|uniref:hypothetical protein n=1 Tax=Burkholderia sp. F1 TaxID=3366817 RepID=UPI003D725CF4